MESVLWNLEERQSAIELLNKIKESISTRSLPGDVYEAHLSTFKKISTEGVFIDNKRRVYLSQRPSREINPSEAYPSQWHSPGVTHLFDEFTPQTILRLVKRELGSGVQLSSPVEVGTYEVNDPQRGVYQLNVSLFKIQGNPKSDLRGRFFTEEEIKSLNLVQSHRDIILPAALTQARALGWL